MREAQNPCAPRPMGEVVYQREWRLTPMRRVGARVERSGGLGARPREALFVITCVESDESTESALSPESIGGFPLRDRECVGRG